jgi:hypothetical protein
MTENRDNWAIIGQGRNGWHAQAANISSVSYDPTDERLNKYAAEAAEGCPVYDASRSTSGFVAFVLGGPMVDPRLSVEESARFVQHPGAVDLAEGAFRTLLQADAAQKANPERGFGGYTALDSVSVETFIHLLREHVSGMRFGCVRSGKVVWDD